MKNTNTYDKDGNLVFEITNKSFKSVYYYGYGNGMPLYLFATKKNNKWTRIKRGYCGTGVHWVELKRNQTINVVVDKSDIPQDNWKLGIPCSRTKTDYLHEYLSIDIDPYLWSKKIEKN